MDHNQIPEKPVVKSLDGGRVENPQPVFFFEREDGTVFHVDEKSAWNLYMRRNAVVGKYPERMKIVGVGDGKLFQKSVLEARDIAKTEGVEKAQERIRKGVDEEFQACKGNVRPPRDFDTIGNGGGLVNMSTLRR